MYLFVHVKSLQLFISIRFWAVQLVKDKGYRYTLIVDKERNSDREEGKSGMGGGGWRGRTLIFIRIA